MNDFIAKKLISKRPSIFCVMWWITQHYEITDEFSLIHLKDVGLDVTTITDAIRDLTRMGYLRKTHTGINGSHIDMNRYQLTEKQ